MNNINRSTVLLQSTTKAKDITVCEIETHPAVCETAQEIQENIYVPVTLRRSVVSF